MKISVASVAEAIERRARMIRFHGSLEAAHDQGHHAYHRYHVGDNDDLIRDWNCWTCVPCWDAKPRREVATERAEDVGLLDDRVVAMCKACRDARESATG